MSTWPSLRHKKLTKVGSIVSMNWLMPEETVISARGAQIDICGYPLLFADTGKIRILESSPLISAALLPHVAG